MRLLCFILLLIEFLDELVFGAREAALPVIRTDLGLSYEQIGLLLSVPALIGNAIEPALGILGDVWRRKALIVGGGLAFTLGLALIAFGASFPALLIAFIVLYPASGAFVSLSQATLMDLNPTRHEQMMARWSLFGAVGVVGGSLALSGTLAVALGWRGLYGGFALLACVLVGAVWVQPALRPVVAPLPNGEQGVGEGGPVDFRAGVMATLGALRDPKILRWLILLDVSDLMLDVFLGFIALYFVDIVHLTEVEAAVAVSVWSTASLVGHALIIPLLERVRGLAYLRWSAAIILLLYASLLSVPSVPIKLILLACLGLSAAGWYSVLRGQLYSAMANQSGISMAVSSLSGMVGGLMPLALGLVAEHFGLPWAMALLALAPISLLVGSPKQGLKAEG